MLAVARIFRPSTESLSAVPASSASTTMSPEVERWNLPSPAETTLNGTMPPSTRRPGNRARNTPTLPTPFCRLTITASSGACFAMTSAISAVSALLTVTSTTPASANIEGSSDRVSAPAAILRSRPSKLVSRKPLASISPITRGRASSATLRRPAASMPPTKQPMLPAPATPIVVWAMVTSCLVRSRNQMQPRIHPHQFAGHVARGRRREKTHQRRDIVRR